MSKKTNSVWVTTQAIAALIGCSKDHIHDLRDRGLFKRGTHWLDISHPGAIRPTYRWNLKNCQKALETPPESR